MCQHGATFGRRALIRGGLSVLAAAAVGDVLDACGPVVPSAASVTPLPPPETKTIRLNFAACDTAFMISEPYLREEGFTDVQLTDVAGQLVPLASGKADMSAPFIGTLVSAVEAGKPFVAIGSIHPGCFELWASKSVTRLADLRGRTVVLNSKGADKIQTMFIYMALEQAGIHPTETNIVVQPDADLSKVFLEGRSDLVMVAPISLTDNQAFRTNPANTGHRVLDQMRDAPWSQQACCVIATTRDWLQANPIAARRALRAIHRAADDLVAGKATADPAKTATDRGLFGGPTNLALVRDYTMMPADWWKYDLAESARFHAKLMSATGLLALPVNDAVAKTVDGRLESDLIKELRG